MARPRRQQILAARPRRPAVRRNLAVGQRRPRPGGGGGGGGRGRGGGGLGAPAPMPWDSTAQRESSVLGNEAADTRATLSNRWQQQQEEMGFGAGASNPYSHAAQLKRQRDVNQRGITNTAGANLYSGSTVNAQRHAQSQYDEGYKQLEAGYDRNKAAYERGVGRTERDYQQGVAAIKEGAINRALASEPQPLAPPGGGGRQRNPNVRRRQQQRQRQARVQRQRQARQARRRR